MPKSLDTPLSFDDLIPDHLYSTKQVAPFFPGNSDEHREKVVRQLCQDGELPGHVRRPAPGGHKSYWIPGSAVRAWRRRNEVKPAKKVA